MLIGGLSGCTSETFAIPVDTVKVNMQLHPDKNKGFLSTANRLRKENGIRFFYQSLKAGLLRQISFNTFRLGVFDFLLNYQAARKGGLEHVKFSERILMGSAAAAIGICFGNPADTMKVISQANPNQKNGLFKSMYKLYNKHGIGVFYKSLSSNILRCITMASTEMAVYTIFKEFLLRNDYMNEGMACYIVCSIYATFWGCFVSNPFDVMKSRLSVGKIVDGKRVPYSSIQEALLKQYRFKGILGFYSGLRVFILYNSIWNSVMFSTKEELTNLFTTHYLK